MKPRQSFAGRRGRPRPSIAVEGVKGFLRYLVISRIDPRKIYSETLLARIRDSEPGDEFPESSFIKMFGPAVRVSGRDHFILDAMFEGAGGMFGAVVGVLLQCESASDVVWQLVRYNHLTGSLGYFRAAIEDDQHGVIWWDAAEVESNQPHVMEYRMGMMAQGIRTVCQDQDMPIDVNLPYSAPAYAAEYKKRFKGSVTFNSDVARLVAPSREIAATLVFPQAPPVTPEGDSAAVRALATDASQLHQMLAQFIREHMTSGNINLEHAARWLRVPSRTLQRWLEKTGIHYQELVDQIRMTEAKNYLAKPTMSLSRIAYALGYTAQTNFQNAFRRWTGVSPGEYRTRLKQQEPPSTDRGE